MYCTFMDQEPNQTLNKTQFDAPLPSFFLFFIFLSANSFEQLGQASSHKNGQTEETEYKQFKYIYFDSLPLVKQKQSKTTTDVPMAETYPPCSIKQKIAITTCAYELCIMYICSSEEYTDASIFHNYTVLICVLLCMPSSVSVLMENINRYFVRVLAVTVTSSVDDWFNHAQAV